jgi:hypothetical protein
MAPPPLDQHELLDAFLTELQPDIPSGVSLVPEWLPALNGWNLWVSSDAEFGFTDHRQLRDRALDLAEQRGLDINVVPMAIRTMDADD